MKRVLFLFYFLMTSNCFAQLSLPSNSGVVNAPIDMNGWRSYKLVLTQNVTSFSFVVLPNGVPLPSQSIVSVEFVENNVGGFTVSFAANILNPCSITTTVNAITVCQFVFDSAANQWTGISGGGSAFGTFPASPNGRAQIACETPLGGVAGTGTFCLPGVAVNTQTLSVPYTVLVSDLGGGIKATNSGAGTINVPDGGTAPFTVPSNFWVFAAGTGDVTLTRTSTSQLCAGAAACANTLVVFSGQFAYVYLDALNNWQVSMILSTNPGTSQTITGATTTALPLKIISAASTANYAFEILDNSGNKIMAVDPESAGAVSFYQAGGNNGVVQIGNTNAPNFYRVDPANSLTTTTGGIKALNYQTSTNCQLGGATGTASPAACGSAVAGMVAVPASQTTYVVNTTAVTANSEIFVQQMMDNSGISTATCNSGVTAPLQSTRTAGTSFTIALTSVASVTCFKYWIVN